MFEFERLAVYQKARKLASDVLKYTAEIKYPNYSLINQVHRSSISIVANTAEGSGRYSKPDKRHFYTMARGSIYETVALLEILYNNKDITQKQFTQLYSDLEEVSKMLMGMIHSQN